MSSLISNLPFTPNIHFNHSVLLDTTLGEAFNVLGTESGFERVAKLSGICAGIKHLRTDTTTIPANTGLEGTSVISLPAQTLADDGSGIQDELVHRHWYEKKENIPLLFGMVQHKITIQVCISYLDKNRAGEMPDQGPVYSLYEDVTQGSEIKIWTLRKFEVEDKRVKITEDCHVWAPPLLRRITERIGRDAHRDHMDAYQTIFE